MSIVSCGSCGMQFNAAGYDPGVQFQCTQCGAMVTVGAVAAAPAPVGRPGAKRATGVQRRGPAGPRAARGGPPAGGQDAGYQQAYAPKKNNSAMFLGIGGGVVVIGIIIAIVVMSSKPSPQESQQSSADKAFETQKEVQAKRDAEVKAKNDALKTTLNAALERGPAIETALRNSDKAALEAMFDWTNYAGYLGDLAKGPEGSKFLGSGPMFSTGEWEKTAEGKMTGKWTGATVHGPESLKTAVMGYIEEFLFGSPEVKFDKARSETLEGGFSNLKINGRDYLGKKIFIEVKGAGKIKEFWVGAPMGDDAVKIINFKDPSALTALQQKAGKANRVVTDDRNPIRDDRDPMGDDPKDPKDPGEEDGPIEDGPAEEELPAMAKTGGSPKEPALINIVNQLKDGNKLKEAQKKTIKDAKAEDRKAMMGALIDALIDAHQSGKRREKGMISHALYETWSNFAGAQGYSLDDATYDIEGRSQSDSDDVIRRWIKVYNEYKP